MLLLLRLFLSWKTKGRGISINCSIIVFLNELCYNLARFLKDFKKGVIFMLTAEFLWKLFESTGSVAAYLLYKRLCSYS